jgi:aspartyl-tRNA(Asn)/glutamyl-tRNA(Gln) amidotransferase subunit C
MVTKNDIQKLAKLARIDISETEAEGLVPEMDSILEYVGQIKNSVGDLPAQAGIEKTVPKLHNVMREDIPTNTARQYTEKILDNAPAREGDYIKVKKIL